MANTIKIAYGSAATAGKTNSAQGELSYSANNDVLWIGKGSNTQVAVGGIGKFVTTDTNQTISGTKSFTSTIEGSINGNAGTASTWATARNITIGNSTQSVNGSGNVIYTLSGIGAVSLSLTSGQIYVGSGLNTATAVTISGDATLSNSGVIIIGNNAITTAKISDSNVTLQKIQDIAAVSVLGNPTNSTDAVDVISAASDDTVLTRVNKGTPSLEFSLVKTNSIDNNAVTVAKIEQVVGRGILGRNATTPGNLSEISASGNGQFLQATTTGLAWSATIDGSASVIKLKGDNSNSAIIPVGEGLDFLELYYISKNNSLYGVKGISGGTEDVVLIAGGTDILMYSDAAPEAEDTFLILSATKNMTLTKVTYVLGAGTCTDAKLKRTRSATTNDIVTFSVSTTEGNTTSLSATYKEIQAGDKLVFNPGTLSSGTAPADLTIQIEYVAGSEGSN